MLIMPYKGKKYYLFGTYPNQIFVDSFGNSPSGSNGSDHQAGSACIVRLITGYFSPSNWSILYERDVKKPIINLMS